MACFIKCFLHTEEESAASSPAREVVKSPVSLVSPPIQLPRETSEATVPKTAMGSFWICFQGTPKGLESISNERTKRASPPHIPLQSSGSDQPPSTLKKENTCFARCFTAPPEDQASVSKEKGTPPHQADVRRTTTPKEEVNPGVDPDTDTENGGTKRRTLSGEEVIELLLYSTDDDPDNDPERVAFAVTRYRPKFFPRIVRKAASKFGRGVMRLVSVRTELAWRRARRGPPEQGRAYTVRITQEPACNCGKFPCEQYQKLTRK